MSYTHLTINERIRIEIFSLFGFSTRFIAKILNRHHSTIARELSRNKSNGFYCAETAHFLYSKRRLSRFPKAKFSYAVAQIISCKIAEKWSPEQIVHAVFNGTIFLRQSTIGYIKVKFLMFQQKIYVIKANVKRKKQEGNLW